MTNEETKKYQKILEEEKARLEKEIAEHEALVDFGADIDGADEEADEAEEIGNRAAINADLKKQLEEIEGAIERIHEGTYGKCLRCGGEISEKVLHIAPESELCEKCKLATA